MRFYHIELTEDASDLHFVLVANVHSLVFWEVIKQVSTRKTPDRVDSSTKFEWPLFKKHVDLPKILKTWTRLIFRYKKWTWFNFSASPSPESVLCISTDTICPPS